MANFSSDTGTVRLGASHVQAVHDDVQQDLAKIRAVVSDLMTAGWAGKASQAFGSTMEDWDGNGRRLLTAMQAIKDLLDKSGETFDVAEQEQIRRMQQADYSAQLGA